ncbi:MAG: hypothetical protein RL648_1539 [Verrucomicrobiota bacterium]
MITHIVFFKMKPTAGGTTSRENLHELVAKLRGLKVAIPEILELEAGEDVSRSNASFDVALITRFASLEALETYRVHPAHVKVVEFIQSVCSERAVVDFH